VTRWHRSTHSSLLLLACLAVGCGKSTEPHAPDRPIRSDEVTDFNTLYSQNCAGCHGADGQFGPAPPLNDPLFLAIVPDEILSKLVTEGRPGTPMPGFSRKKGGSLTDKQVKAIADGIKVRWKPVQPRTSPPDYLASIDHGNAGRGEKVFNRACASCHGPDGLGGKDKVGPIHNEAFLSLISDQAIRRYIITGRRDLKMPDFAGTAGRPADFQPLSPTDVADLVEFLSSWRHRSIALGNEPRRSN
jgi:cytochrome c oxidase cbb3-type subunit 3